MKKRYMAMILAIAMLNSTTAFAVDSQAKNNTIFTEDDLSQYEQVVVFSEEASDTDNANNKNYNYVTNAQENITRAKEAVVALNLRDQGLEYIEDSCLAELDALAQEDECTLHEYSVLIPKSRAETPRYYATYKNTDFYTAVTSSSNITLEKKNFAKYDKLRMWSQNLISLGLCFSSKLAMTLTWTAVTSDFPTANYTVHTSDWTDTYININAQNRAIYVKEGGSYKNVANREFGDVRPYLVYHFNDANSETGTIETTYDKKPYEDVTVDTRESLLYVAYKVYTSGINPTNFLLKNIVSMQWYERTT